MRITITDRFLYSYIKSFTKNNKPVFASNEHISKEIGKSESVVSHSISRLIKLGYLENKGNKYSRQLYTKSNLVTADFNQSNADFNQSTVNNSITCDEIKRVIAENSNNEKLKTAIANAENSYILIKLLIKYTSIEKEIDKEKETSVINTLQKFKDWDWRADETFKEWIKYKKKNTDFAKNSFLNECFFDRQKEDVITYCESKGVKYKNYVSALQGFVNKEVKRRGA